MEFQHGQYNNKRQRSVYTLPIISQDDYDYDDDCAMADDCCPFNSPAPKRFRACHEAFITSPDVVSDADISDCSTIAMESFPTTVTRDEKTNKKEWWKQASVEQKRQNLLGENDLECHVCGSIYKDEVNEAALEEAALAENVMPNNSLLAYFSCKTPAASRNLPPPSLPQSPQSKTSCTFCERSTCKQCLGKCEECMKPFCTFCLKNDYWGAFARVVCLDCFNDDGTSCDDDDAMKL
eukprot:scaffold4026_cov117-Cylindrotheca_fusiformis.AAC.25